MRTQKVFKGKMDAVEAWNGIKGSRMVIYHLEDAVISYDPASLHLCYHTPEIESVAVVGGTLVLTGRGFGAGQSGFCGAPRRRPHFCPRRDFGVRFLVLL